MFWIRHDTSSLYYKNKRKITNQIISIAWKIYHDLNIQLAMEHYMQKLSDTVVHFNL